MENSQENTKQILLNDDDDVLVKDLSDHDDEKTRMQRSDCVAVGSWKYLKRENDHR